MATRPYLVVRACRHLGAAALAIVLLVASACGGKSAPTTTPRPQATQRPAVQATVSPTVEPAQPAATPTQGRAAAPQASATTLPAATPATKPAAGKFANPDELDSYRMKTTTWEKGADKSTGSVILVEWVKDPPSKHTVMGAVETITIGDQTWVKLMGNWVLQNRQNPQPQARDLSASIMRQVEDKFVYQEVGRETINGIACKHYTYSGEATVQLSEGAVKGEATVTGQGESWVADQPGLPQVVVRSRGENETKMKAPSGSGATGDISIAMNIETELYDINTPITIAAPEGAITPPTGPAAPTAGPAPTRVAVPTLPAGLASLTAIPELQPCFDGFPLPASARQDADTATLARLVATGLGSPSEARGYKTADPAADVQQFIETEALAAGWELGTMMEGQNTQFWSKDQFVLVLNIFPPSESSTETAIAVACGMAQ